MAANLFVLIHVDVVRLVVFVVYCTALREAERPGKALWLSVVGTLEIFLCIVLSHPLVVKFLINQLDLISLVL